MTTSDKVRIISIISAEPIQDILSEHSRLPYEIKHEICEIVCMELTGIETYQIKDFSAFRVRYGIFGELLMTMQILPFWKNLKMMMMRFPDAAVVSIQTILKTIFTYMETVSYSAADFTTLAYRLRTDIEQYAEFLQKLPQTTIFKCLKQNLKYSPEMYSLTDKRLIGRVSNLIKMLVQKHSKELPESLQNKFNDLSSEDKDMLFLLILAATAAALMEYELFTTYIVPNIDIYKGFKSMVRTILPQHKTSSYEKHLLKNIEKLASIFSKKDDFTCFSDLVGRLLLKTGSSHSQLEPQQASVYHTIDRSGNLARLIPAELINITRPKLRPLFYARLIEQKLLSYELSELISNDSEELRRGPAVMLIDTSGSMEGQPELYAKAFGCALALRMAQEHRALHIILFSGTNEQISFTLHPGAGYIQDIIDFCAFSFGGWTDFDAALIKAIPRFSEPEFSAADLVMITDGGDSISTQTIKNIHRLKTRSLIRIWGIIIGNNDSNLGEIADACIHISRNGTWDSTQTSKMMDALCSSRKAVDVHDTEK